MFDIPTLDDNDGQGKYYLPTTYTGTTPQKLYLKHPQAIEGAYETGNSMLFDFGRASYTSGATDFVLQN